MIKATIENDTNNIYDSQNCWIRTLPNGKREFFSKIYYNQNFERRDEAIIKEIEILLNEK
jgi:hypothetical protein